MSLRLVCLIYQELLGYGAMPRDVLDVLWLVYSFQGFKYAS